jgi:F0F1-type ATP synthase membrane subunit b/b'
VNVHDFSGLKLAQSMEGQMAHGGSGPSGRETHTSTDEFVQAAQGEAHAAKEQAREAVAEMKAEVRAAADDVKDQARASAAKQKDAAARQMDGWAHALKTASDDLDSRGQASAAAYVRQAADGLERASGTVRERGVDDLIGTVEDFARRQPVAFLGGAVAAGFGLARLMKSSADRRRSAPAGSRMDAGRHMGEGGGL